MRLLSEDASSWVGTAVNFISELEPVTKFGYGLEVGYRFIRWIVEFFQIRKFRGKMHATVENFLKEMETDANLNRTCAHLKQNWNQIQTLDPKSIFGVIDFVDVIYQYRIEHYNLIKKNKKLDRALTDFLDLLQKKFNEAIAKHSGVPAVFAAIVLLRFNQVQGLIQILSKQVEETRKNVVPLLAAEIRAIQAEMKHFPTIENYVELKSVLETWQKEYEYDTARANIRDIRIATGVKNLTDMLAEYINSENFSNIKDKLRSIQTLADLKMLLDSVYQIKQELYEIKTIVTSIQATQNKALDVNKSMQRMLRGTGARKKVFLSYGRPPPGGPLAARLKVDLETRGHTVWVDTSEIKAGKEWDADIEEVIERSDIMIAVLTFHAMSRNRVPPGVCLDEISYAHSIAKPILPLMVEQCIPPLSIARVQYLDLTDCVAADGTVDELRYPPKLARVFAVLEGGVPQFEGTQSLLEAELEPIDFGAEIEFTLGGEVHKINKPAVVSIPGGVKHCPIKFTKVTKPLIFLEVSLTRIWKPGGRAPKKQADLINKVEEIKKLQKNAAGKPSAKKK